MRIITIALEHKSNGWICYLSFRQTECHELNNRHEVRAASRWAWLAYYRARSQAWRIVRQLRSRVRERAV